MSIECRITGELCKNSLICEQIRNCHESAVRIKEIRIGFSEGARFREDIERHWADLHKLPLDQFETYIENLSDTNK